MNCPTCGVSVGLDQQFCRSCGTPLPAEAPQRIRPQMLTLISVLVTFAGIILAIAGSMAGLRWLNFTGVFIAIAGMFSVVAGSLILQMRGPGRPQPKDVSQQPTLERADTTSKLLPIGQNDFIPSVVEDTTELLQPLKQKQLRIDETE